VPLTDADLRRLLEAGRDPLEHVEWLTPDEIDMTGEPETWVRLSGLRLMVLKWRDDACSFWGSSEGCTVYDARPLACRTYPLWATFGRRGGVKRLRLIDGSASVCDFARDGHVDVPTLRADTQRQTTELVRYAERVAGWNRLQNRRIRFRQALEGGEDFIRWLLAEGRRSARPPYTA
jgi:Fe-S-cluster containining protein